MGYFGKGPIRINGKLYDSSGNVGAGTSVLISTGVGVSWTPISVASLQGIQGIQGTQGIQGVQGTQGIQGVQGIQGIQGIQGTQGLEGNFTIFRQSTPPSAGVATAGDYWVDEDDGITYFYYYDGNSTQWVEFGPTPQQVQVSGSTIGISTAGGIVGTGVSVLDFRGSGISTITVSSGVGTINIQSGGSTTPDISPVMMGMIF